MSAPFEVHSIAFGAASGFVRLKNHVTKLPVAAPEYEKGARNEPVCFVGGSVPQLTLILRRLPGYMPGRYTIGATGTHGGIAAKPVTPVFGAGGLSDPIRFDLAQPLPKIVQRAALSLAWSARRDGVPAAVAIGPTTHNLFVILNAPVEPWVQETPWVAALDLACNWAGGAKTLDEAAARISDKYFASARVSYDTAAGATKYGANNHRSFNLSEMLERLTGGVGLGEKVNCTDSAMTVSTLSNLLGCELWQARMSGPNGFKLNPIQAIGYTNWVAPFGGGFSYHEVAWKGSCSAGDALFDGCLKVDGDANPGVAPHTPLLPTNILFGDCTTLNYRKRLASAQGCQDCQPQAGSARRRTLV